jgi:hypothetical protein
VDDRQFGYITKLRKKNPPGMGSSSRCAEKMRISQQKKLKKEGLLWTNEEGLPTNS